MATSTHSFSNYGLSLKKKTAETNLIGFVTQQGRYDPTAKVAQVVCLIPIIAAVEKLANFGNDIAFELWL